MSNQQCIEEAKKMIEEEENCSKIGFDREDYINSSSRIDGIKELIERLESLPKEQSRYEIAKSVMEEFILAYSQGEAEEIGKGVNTMMQSYDKWLEDKNR